MSQPIALIVSVWCTYACTCVCPCGGQRPTLGVPQESFTLFFEKGSFTDWIGDPPFFIFPGMDL